MLKVYPMANATNNKCKELYQNKQGLAKKQARFFCQVAHGFLLIDVMIALVMASVFCLVVAWYQGHTAMLYHDAQARMQALVAARRVIADVEKRELARFGMRHEPQGVIRWSTDTYAGLSQQEVQRLGMPAVKRPALDCVCVTVAWRTARMQEQTVMVRGVIHAQEKNKS